MSLVCKLPIGLIFYIKEEPIPVPLTQVDIQTKVVDFIAQVTVEQKYINKEKNPIEVVYRFPIEESAAVVNFEAELDGRTIVTKVESKKKAADTYQEAIRNRQTAVLLEETTPDIFQIKVGQLKSGSNASIKITYISELPVDENAIRLTIPTTIAPRYVPPTDNSEAAEVIKSIPYSLDTPAPLTFQMEVTSQSKILAIKSPSHGLESNIKLEKVDGLFNGSAKLSANTGDLNKDLVMLIETEEPHQLVAYVEKSDDGSLTGMVSLVPSFKLEEQKVELIFLVDRSGSMGGGYFQGSSGGTIESAKKALSLFLHSLPADCYFNIFSFGSHFDSLFDGSKKYDDSTLAAAKVHAASMDANYGGTEIYQPIEKIFGEPSQPGYLKQIFVLTDGEVSNADGVIQLVKRNCHKGRLFAMGLGASASRHLVKGIARAGGGTALFAAENEDLRGKVMTQLKNALQPAITNIKITWDGVENLDGNTQDTEVVKEKTLLGFMKPKKPNLTKTISMDGQTPKNIPAIYDGSRLLVYRIFPTDLKEAPKKVKISAETPSGSLDVELPITDINLLKGEFVAKLAGRKMIQDLEELPTDKPEDEKAIEEAVIKIGLKYKLASRHTSFVGVDLKSGSMNDGEPAMMTREIKNQVPSGFGMGPSGFGMGPSGGMMLKCYAAPMMASVAPRMAPMRGNSIATGSAKMRLRKSNATELANSSLFSYKVAALEDVAFSDSVDCWDAIDKGSNFQVEKVSDPLTSLIDLQAFDGFFTWGDIISTKTGKSKEELAVEFPESPNDKHWITVLVVVLLEAMEDEKDLWELVVGKARKALRGEVAQEKLDTFFTKAKQFVN